MELKISRVYMAGAPALQLSPIQAKGRGAVFHGYGSHKGEVLGLALTLALASIETFVPDLPGHGENLELLTGENLIQWGRSLRDMGISWGVGHSLGGRLALYLEIPRLFLISLPTRPFFEGSRRQMVKILRPRWVREERPLEGLRDSLALLPLKWPAQGTLLVAQGDLQTCREAAKQAREQGWEVKEIRATDHLNIIQAPATYRHLEFFCREAHKHGFSF